MACTIIKLDRTLSKGKIRTYDHLSDIREGSCCHNFTRALCNRYEIRRLYVSDLHVVNLATMTLQIKHVGKMWKKSASVNTRHKTFEMATTNKLFPISLSIRAILTILTELVLIFSFKMSKWPPKHISPIPLYII